jgi:hypothetical protein
MWPARLYSSMAWLCATGIVPLIQTAKKVEELSYTPITPLFRGWALFGIILHGGNFYIKWGGVVATLSDAKLHRTPSCIAISVSGCYKLRRFAYPFTFLLFVHFVTGMRMEFIEFPSYQTVSSEAGDKGYTSTCWRMHSSLGRVQVVFIF